MTLLRIEPITLEVKGVTTAQLNPHSGGKVFRALKPWINEEIYQNYSIHIYHNYITKNL